METALTFEEKYSGHKENDLWKSQMGKAVNFPLMGGHLVCTGVLEGVSLANVHDIDL